MNSDQWERAKEIFDAAADLPIDERHGFVADACHGDSALQLEVEGLLKASERADNFLDIPAVHVKELARPTRQANNFDEDFLPDGELISGRFKIRRLLGSGGMGRVYEAVDTDLGVRVALKTIRSDISSDDRSRRRFKQEVQLTRRITHPNVCRVFDFGRHTPKQEPGGQKRDEFLFFTMELLEGETLADLLRRKGKLELDEALPIIEEIANGLAAAHSLGIVHRDIKPSNILLVPSGEGRRVVVTDFGLARPGSPPKEGSASRWPGSLTEDGGLVGTLAYMAPEQLEGAKVKPTTDVYAFGLLIYEMVTGVKPFDEDLPLGGIAQRISTPPPSPREYVPELNSNWESAILGCLQVEPANRFQHPGEIVAAIQAHASVLLKRPFAKPSQRQLSIRKTRPTHRIWMVIVYAMLVVAVSASVLAYRRWYTTAKVEEGTYLLLTDIKNSTDQARFDGVTELFRSQLVQSPYFRLVSRSDVYDVLHRMNRTDLLKTTSDTHGNGWDPEVGREVAMRLGASRIVFGTISSSGETYALSIKSSDRTTSRG